MVSVVILEVGGLLGYRRSCRGRLRRRDDDRQPDAVGGEDMAELCAPDPAMPPHHDAWALAAGAIGRVAAVIVIVSCSSRPPPLCLDRARNRTALGRAIAG